MAKLEDTLQINLVSLFNDNIRFKENNKFNIISYDKIQYYEVINSKCFITHHKNEMSNYTVGAWKKNVAMGMIAGQPDLEIKYFNEEKQCWSFFYIELKTIDSIKKKNYGLNKNEIDFHNFLNFCGINVYIAYNRETFLECLIKENIIKKNG